MFKYGIQTKINVNAIAKVTEGMSGSQIDELMQAAAKKHLMTGSLKTTDVTVILMHKKTRYSENSRDSMKILCEMLDKGVSLRAAASALGVSHSTLEYQIKSFRRINHERNDKKPFMIPETEIDNVGKKPTGRNRQYKISHLEHGRKLSQGLEQIAGFFQNTRSLEGADELNIFAFKVILQDEEDFASQKGFIENEGLTINAVKDSRQAVVSAPQDVFDELQKRVFRYRDRGTKKNFQYIREFKPFTAEDKKADSVLRLFKDKPEIDPVDVQIMLLPSIATDVRQRAQASIAKKFKAKRGLSWESPIC
jgi:hypothetical protein